MSRVPPHQRPSARELASGNQAGGYACPDCGCKDWRDDTAVSGTYSPKGRAVIRRFRPVKCRHCGKRMTIRTAEVFEEIIEESQEEEGEPAIFRTNAKTA